MARVFVGLGSNLGNGQQNILFAWKRLGEIKEVRLICLSNPYLTEPIGMESQSWFTNAVGEIETELSPQKLLDEMLQIEAETGRDREKTKDRPVDLDILYYDDQVYNSPQVTIPHPALQDRLFVLAPLEEIAADFLHPVFSKTTKELRQALVPGQVVIKESWQERGEF